MKSFEYFYTKTAMGVIEVEDDGNCVIEASNDEGLFYYLYISTSMGYTKIVEYGPAAPDFNELPQEVSCTFNRIQYDTKKIAQKVSMFLNNPKRQITQAKEATVEDFLDNCKSILDYVSNPTNF